MLHSLSSSQDVKKNFCRCTGCVMKNDDLKGGQERGCDEGGHGLGGGGDKEE